jgi:DNA-binding transcriptional ArsR family regulator
MNEDVDMKDGTGLDDGAGLDAQGAAAILQEAGERARRELRVSHPVIFIAGGVAWLLGYGAIWLSVRGQHPYQGPAPEAAIIQVVLIGFAVAITASIISRATSGVGGLSAVQRRVSILAFVSGMVAVLVLEAAIDHAGASRLRRVPGGGTRPGRRGGLRRELRRQAELDPARAGPLAGRRGRWRRVRGPGGGLGRDRPGRRTGLPADGSARARPGPAPVSEDDLDPVIHAPARLRIVVTLAALPDGDNLSFTRLQDLIGLTPGNLITHLRKLDDAGYVRMEKSGSGVNGTTSVSLTREGRSALDRYTSVLRDLLDQAGSAPVTPVTGAEVDIPGRPA